MPCPWEVSTLIPCPWWCMGYLCPQPAASGKDSPYITSGRGSGYHLPGTGHDFLNHCLLVTFKLIWMLLGLLFKPVILINQVFSKQSTVVFICTKYCLSRMTSFSIKLCTNHIPITRGPGRRQSDFFIDFVLRVFFFIIPASPVSSLQTVSNIFGTI